MAKYDGPPSHIDRASARPAVRPLRALAATLLVVLAGCNGTSDTTAPRDFRAVVGDCFDHAADPPVDCAQPHLAQTVFVGDKPPLDTALAVKPCRRAQAHFLGADLNTRLDVQLWISNDETWYRCDLVLRRSTRSGRGHEDLVGSLKGTLKEGAPANIQACLDGTYRPATDQPYVSCAEPHVAQELTFAPAIGVLDEPFPSDVAARSRNACNAAASAARMLGANRSVHAFFPNDARAWSSGQRSALCWVEATRGKLPAVS